MALLAESIILVASLRMVFSEIIIPDSVSPLAKEWVYYPVWATWYSAHNVCASHGGHLVLVDGQNVADDLTVLDNLYEIGGVHTSMVRHNNTLFYSNDDACEPVNETFWKWKYPDHAEWDFNAQCVVVSHPNFTWIKSKCGGRYDFVCEFPAECPFQLNTSVSLASLPVNNASMAVCQAMCRQMIGCFATAPSGHATLPSFTHCLFVVTGDSTNPMATMNNCHTNYSVKIVDAPFEDLGPDPPDCEPSNEEGSEIAQKPLEQFLREFNTSTVDCNQTVTISPSTVVETSYVSLTPDIITNYATLTDYVTLTPEIITDYVTLQPVMETQEVTRTQTLKETKTVEQIVTTTVREAHLSSLACPTPEPLNDTTAATPATSNKTKEEALKEMQAVVKSLTVNPRNVSRFRRMKESAPDTRRSAQAAGGWALGLMTVLGLLIVLSDVASLYHHVQRIRKVEHGSSGSSITTENTNQP